MTGGFNHSRKTFGARHNKRKDGGDYPLVLDRKVRRQSLLHSRRETNDIEARFPDEMLNCLLDAHSVSGCAGEYASEQSVDTTRRAFKQFTAKKIGQPVAKKQIKTERSAKTRVDGQAEPGSGQMGSRPP